MKKIGILTFFWAHNPGTFLQAYATYQAIKRRFPDYSVEIIDYRFRRIKFNFRLHHFNCINFYKELKKYYIFNNFQNKFLKKSKHKYIGLDYDGAKQFLLQNQYDLIVVGSDIVLYLLEYHYRNSIPSIYWLPEDLHCVKVMLSSSGYNVDCAALSEGLKSRLTKSINDFNLITVRDEMTYDLITKTLGLNNHSILDVSPDPTFDLVIDYSHGDSYVQKLKIDSSKRIAIINLPPGHQKTQMIIKCLKSKGFKVASFNYNPMADYNLTDISPFEWAGIYKYATITLTDRFHGTIYSLKNFTPVLVIYFKRKSSNQYNRTKTYHLLKEFNMQEMNYIHADHIQNSNQISKSIDLAIEYFDKKLITGSIARNKQKYEEVLNRMRALLT